MNKPMAMGILLISALLIAGCSDQGPVRVGFIGGVSGRVADLGMGGRNGVILAIELQNQNGGIDGRPLELLIEDDRQDPATARQAVQRLLDQKVEVILGPMTSAMAMEVVPITNQNKTLTMGITVTTNELTGIDDYFIRTLAPTRVHAGRNALYNFEDKGIKRVAIAYDLRNRSFTESWMKDFRGQFEALGGEVSAIEAFESSNETDFAAVADRMMASSPQGVVLVANSLDTALLAKQVRTLDAAMPLVASEWGGTERLLEMGGRHVEGLVVGQFFDRYSTAPFFLAFDRSYQERFGRAPGFPATIAYNAARVVIEGLENQQEGQPLKDTLLQIGTFQGLQGPVKFDRFGDITARTHLTEVRDGQFVALE